MAADSNFLTNLGVLGPTPIVPSKRGPVRSSQPDPNFMQNIGAFGPQSAPAPATTKPADQSFMQNLGVFSGGSRPEDPMQMMRREAGRTDIQRGLLDDGSFGFKDVYGRPLKNGKVQGPKNGTDSPRTRDVAPPRQSTVLQKGTQTGPTSTPIDMSRGFDAMIGDLGLSDYANFSSNQLPTTGANPFTATPSVTPGFGEEIPDIGGYNGATYDSKEGAEAAGSRDLSQFAPMTGKETRIEGASDRKKGGSLADALADTAGINSYMSKFSSGDRQRAADRAFLDAPTSMEGLRRKEAVNGVVYASGNHYIDGGEGNPAQKLDTRQEARDIADGKTTAAALLDKYKTRITESQKSSPVESQEPEVSVEKPDIKQDFGRTETLSAPMNTSIPDNVEFNSNNDNPLPAFDKTGGYKSGFKRIDTSMTKPFG
jgi:hypothetical protein